MNRNESPPKKSYSLVPPTDEAPGFLTTCPRCGGEIDLMSREEETRCVFCDHKLYERESTSH